MAESYGHGQAAAGIRLGRRLGIVRLNGVRIVGHSGSTPGYESELSAYPDLGYTVVLLPNQDGVLPPALRHTQETLTVS